MNDGATRHAKATNQKCYLVRKVEANREGHESAHQRPPTTVSGSATTAPAPAAVCDSIRPPVGTVLSGSNGSTIERWGVPISES